MTARGAERARDLWGIRVSEFLHEKASRDSVGEPWLKRMDWELRRVPQLLVRVGSPARLSAPHEVTAEQIRALRRGLPWEAPTFAIHFHALRPFLRWGKNPIATDSSLWRLPSTTPTHRRWLTRDQLVRLYGSARGLERVLVALEGFNGLRRVEVLRLRVKDILWEEGCLRVLGKGRHGGKWRNIPMQEEVRRALQSWVPGKRPDERVVPYSTAGADGLLRRAAIRAGFRDEGVRVSHHDLRRTFGRLANASGMNLVSLQSLFGHASPELSAHYIGLDIDELKGALERFGSFIGRLTPPPEAARRPVPPGTNSSTVGHPTKRLRSGPKAF